LACLGVGAVGYGISLVFFVLALRGIGAARTGALFGAAPFMGAALSAALFPESRLWVLAPAGAAIIVGTWLLVTERHGHGPADSALARQRPQAHDAAGRGEAHAPADTAARPGGVQA
jgi:drug/metabolite transporter (DMT)-like permease